MKLFLRMTLISSAIVLALTGCDTQSNPTDKQTTTHAEQTITSAEQSANPNKVTLTTQTQKDSYALGSSFASSLKESEIDIDPDYIISGLTETFNSKSQLSNDETDAILSAIRQRVMEKAKARFEKEKAENIEAGSKFRSEFAKQSGVKQTKSGLLYQIINQGSSHHPTKDSNVIVHYEGKLVDGRKFDSSYDRGETVSFKLDEVIKGWAEGIQLIGVGGKIKLVIPPELAYGSQYYPVQGDKAAILPESTLVFEISLLGIDGDNNGNNQQSSFKQIR